MCETTLTGQAATRMRREPGANTATMARQSIWLRPNAPLDNPARQAPYEATRVGRLSSALGVGSSISISRVETSSPRSSLTTALF